MPRLLSTTLEIELISWISIKQEVTAAAGGPGWRLGRRSQKLQEK